MVDQVLVGEIVASLVRRGFASGLVERHEDLVTQVLAVDEELGEVSRLARRIRQLVDVEDAARMADECADVLIAATCLASKACGPDLGRIIKAKLAQDEQRGFLHRGGPLNPTPAWLLRHLAGNVQALAGEAAWERREDEAGPGRMLWLAMRMPTDYVGGLEIQGLFTSQQQAVAACVSPLDLVGPVTVGVDLSQLDEDWPAWYPCAIVSPPDVPEKEATP